MLSRAMGRESVGGKRSFGFVGIRVILLHSHNYRHVRNRHIMFITIEHIEHRNLKIRKHVTNSLFRYETFYYFWVKCFDIRRETQSFYAGFFIWPLSRAAHTARKFVSISEPQKSNLLVRRLVFNSSNFLRNPQNPPRAPGVWLHPHFVTRFIISGYCDISEWHVRSVRPRA